MIITIASILIISAAVLVTKRIWPSFSLCPVCAGVSGTWLWMLIVGYYGYPTDTNIIGLLMGGSVVGIAYQLESKIRPGRVMSWKILFIPAGFAMAYSLLYFSWIYLTLSAVVILILLFIFLVWPASGSASRSVERLEDKMKNCC